MRTRPDKVKQIIQSYVDKLIDRIKERIDDVKVEILTTLQGLIGASMELQDNTIESDLLHKSSLVR